MNEKTAPKMPFGWAMFCLGFLLVSMVASVLWLDISIHINLLTSIAVTLGVAYLNNGHDWKALSDAIDYGGKICIQPTVIMMLIGVLIASWIACGTVPMIIYWGLKRINPSVFLLTTCLITAIAAISIGGSWSAAGPGGHRYRTGRQPRYDCRRHHLRRISGCIPPVPPSSSRW